MKIDQNTIEKISHLARLKLNEQQTEEMKGKMEQILSWMEKLNELDTIGVEPLTHMSAELNHLREDVVTQHLSKDEALKNAPSADQNFFRVPRIIE
jgi:aspartyl-tRNA(Asn)/glutamyl-tRNA(Gln) amidotransferase subunit C